jgi:hypothetical protein
MRLTEWGHEECSGVQLNLREGAEKYFRDHMVNKKKRRKIFWQPGDHGKEQLKLFSETPMFRTKGDGKISLLLLPTR